MSSKGRLTRQELGWLLTQEAAGAAERLRSGVQILRSVPPPPGPVIDPMPGPGGDVHVEASLDALDDVMKMLSNLHAKPSTTRGRRGRMDVAAILWEVAPEARVSIEPGSGTEVFGDEGELRRMLHVLVGHGSGMNSEFLVRRDGDDVRISVVLGPDSSASAETERAWLNRMAIRFGGRLELEGGSEVLILPADNVSEKNERDALRKELDEARKQGEAYARELAAVFAQGEVAPPSTFPPPQQSNERLPILAQFAGGLASELRAMLYPVGRDLQAMRSPSTQPATPADEKMDAVRRRMAQAQDFVALLASFGDLESSEMPSEVDLVDAARAAIRAVSARADRNEVTVKLVVVPEGEATRAFVRTQGRAAQLLMRELVSQAVAATPRGRAVILTVSAPGASAGAPNLGARITIDDGGPPLPSSAHRQYLALELDPKTYGRPSSIPLFMCAEITAASGALLELADSDGGGLRVVVTYPRG